MNTLNTVIRLHRWNLDEKRRALGELEALASRLDDQISRLDSDLAGERDLASAGGESAAAFAAYLKGVRTRRAHLAESRGQVSLQVSVAGDEISEAYRELKKFEVAQADRDRRAHIRLRRREAQILDEVALTGHVRRSGTESAG